MGQRIAAQNERSLTTTVSDIEHIESQSLAGIAVIKVFFQPNANIQTAIAQVVADRADAAAPAAARHHAAADHQVLGVEHPGDPARPVEPDAARAVAVRRRGQHRCGRSSITIPGVAIPFPYGGKNRLISVDLDTQALQARGLSPADVVNAINAQNLILPSGTAKFGPTEYTVKMNGSPDAIAGLNDLPVRTVNGATTYLRDVAYVRDGFSPQTNIVRQDGERGVLLSVLKNGGASTLDIVVQPARAAAAACAQRCRRTSRSRRCSTSRCSSRRRSRAWCVEALIAAALTAAMVLLFLGNWRSTLIIALTIPLSILASMIVLQALGETLNLMTLGGLALSVGILVDQAIVTIENIERHLHMGTELHEAILVGAGEIACRRFVSTLCICIVFVPMFFLSGVARFLFVPLAEAVVFAMVASYILSRTLVPTLVMLLMRGTRTAEAPMRSRACCSASTALRRRFERVRRAYTLVLSAPAGAPWPLRRPVPRLLPAVVRAVSVLGATSSRASTPARSACTCARRPARASRRRRASPTRSRRRSASSCRRTSSRPSSTTSACQQRHQPVVQQRRHHRHARRRDPAVAEGRPPADRGIRDAAAPELPKRFPGIEFFFQPADIVTQILNFGLPAAIDVQFTGNDLGGQRRARAPSWSSRSGRSPARSTRTCTSASTRRRSTCRWTARACSRSA